MTILTPLLCKGSFLYTSGWVRGSGGSESEGRERERERDSNADC